MKKHIVLIACFIISIFGLDVMAYNTYNVCGYGNPYSSTYEPVPFKSTSPITGFANYNTVKPLNDDGTVSMDYTTYKWMCGPRRSGGLWDDEPPDGPGIGELTTPIGEPVIPLLIMMFAYLTCLKLKRHG